MNITDAELHALLEKAEKATPGPWDKDVQRLSSGFYAAVGPELMNRPAADCDAAFLESANPSTVAALVRELLKYRQEALSKFEHAPYCPCHPDIAICICDLNKTR